MGQQEILNYLKKCKNWKTTNQISSKLKISKPNINSVLNKLIKQGEIFIKKEKGHYAPIFLYKIR